MALLFTGDNGKVFEIAPEDLPSPVSPDAYTSFDGASPVDPIQESQKKASIMKPSPLGMVSNTFDTPDEPVAGLPPRKAPRKAPKEGSRRHLSVSDNSGTSSSFEPPKVVLVYNDYGELVDVEKLKQPVNSAELTVTETMRLIYKAYHYKVSNA
jgi:hypothetical protein